MELGLAMLVFALVVTGIAIWAGRPVRRQVARLVAERGIDLDEAVSLVQTEGFIVVDHFFGRSVGLRNPTVWWCPGNILGESRALLLRLRDEGRVVVRNRRPVGPSAKELEAVPQTRIIESRVFEMGIGNPLDHLIGR